MGAQPARPKLADYTLTPKIRNGLWALLRKKSLETTEFE
jgi:hypothetical protein